MKSSFLSKLQEYVRITFGFSLVAIAVEFFLLPNDIASGGVTGIAIILHGINNKISTGLVVLIVNIFLFILSLFLIGSKFGGKSLFAIAGLSVTIMLLNKIFPAGSAATKNIMLATIFGTMLSGTGMGIVFNENASTGGTDIIAKLLNKYFHLAIGKALLSVDFLVTFFAAVVFSPEIGMYALLGVLINGFVIDSVIEGFNSCKEVTIISSESEKIINFIIGDLQRGCTALNGYGCYNKEEVSFLYVLVSRREFIKLKGFLKETDKNAFIVCKEAKEVLGEGFKNIL